jgi:hypothetical protein
MHNNLTLDISHLEYDSWFDQVKSMSIRITSHSGGYILSTQVLQLASIGIDGTQGKCHLYLNGVIHSGIRVLFASNSQMFVPHQQRYISHIKNFVTIVLMHTLCIYIGRPMWDLNKGGWGLLYTLAFVLGWPRNNQGCNGLHVWPSHFYSTSVKHMMSVVKPVDLCMTQSKVSCLLTWWH